MASMNVYTPPIDQRYTRGASPDYQPPLITRKGKLYTFSQTAINTYSVYVRPEGYRARLVYAMLVRQFAGPVISVRVDDQDIFMILTAATVYSSTPFINSTFENALEIQTSLKIDLATATGSSRYMFVIVEEPIVNNA